MTSLPLTPQPHRLSDQRSKPLKLGALADTYLHLYIPCFRFGKSPGANPAPCAGLRKTPCTWVPPGPHRKTCARPPLLSRPRRALRSLDEHQSRSSSGPTGVGKTRLAARATTPHCAIFTVLFARILNCSPGYAPPASVAPSTPESAPDRHRRSSSSTTPPKPATSTRSSSNTTAPRPRS